MTTIILTKLRTLMKDVGYNSKPIQALIVTNHDAHMSEYLADRDRRLKFISGFCGSAGTAIVTEKEALMWTDGRYFIQAAKEMDVNWTLMKIGVFGTVSESTWLSNNLKEGSVVGTDPRHIPYSVWMTMQRELQQANISLVPLTFNYVDEIWENKPSMPKTIAKTLDIKYTGKTASFKIEKINSVMQEKGVDLLILTALDDIAWLLNLRGNDIDYNPVFFSFLIIHGEQLHLFVNESKITPSVISHFDADHIKVQLHPYETFYDKINELAKSIKKVWICRSANYKIYDTFPEMKRYCECSPVTYLKAIKNDDEVQGMIYAHIKDGVALCRYFAWLENEINKGELTEISAAKILEGFRQEEKDYIGPSFQTISSSGPNAAITHYMPSEDSDRPLTPKEIYLCDSGAQYLDGTTDVTRTFHYGEPSQFERECFTRVFKGVVAIANAIFPYGIKGNCLDSFARKALWDVGLDYKHGTGHGIGSYLFVHEGPMGISWRPYPDDPGLQPNMFLSDEPGYYHEGQFGIRIENIVRIIPTKTKYEMPLSEKGFLTFETITLCPIQSKMLITSNLTTDELKFLNVYHKKVFDTLGPILESRGYSDAYKWLQKETAEIIQNI